MAAISQAADKKMEHKTGDSADASKDPLIPRLGWIWLRGFEERNASVILYDLAFIISFLTFPDVPRNLNSHIQIRTQMTTAFGMCLESSGNL